MIHTNQDVEFAGYYVRYPYHRKVVFLDMSFMSAFEKARNGAEYYEWFEIYRGLKSKSGYYEPMFDLKCRYYVNR